MADEQDRMEASPDAEAQANLVEALERFLKNAQKTGGLSPELREVISALRYYLTQSTLGIFDAFNLGLLVYNANPYKSAEHPLAFTIAWGGVETQEEPGTWKFNPRRLYP